MISVSHISSLYKPGGVAQETQKQTHTAHPLSNADPRILLLSVWVEAIQLETMWGCSFRTFPAKATATDENVMSFLKPGSL